MIKHMVGDKVQIPLTDEVTPIALGQAPPELISGLTEAVHTKPFPGWAPALP